MISTPRPVILTNWSKSAYSSCYLYPASSVAEITQALAHAHSQGLTVIPHGAGHSYTDAALNTGAVVLDVTPMRKILAWDAQQGIMQVEPGVTVRELLQTTWKDGWWPYAVPSIPAVTLGGCAAMNVNGKNAWKCGPFGTHILSLDVLLASGELCTLTPDRDPLLFHAVVGSLGLLGIITSITVQLQRISSGQVGVRSRRATSLAELFALFAEEAADSDFMEAWLDGFATGAQLGRGILTSATLLNNGGGPTAMFSPPDALERMETSLVHLAAPLARSILLPGARVVNRAYFASGTREQQQSLIPFTFWPSMAFAGYQTALVEGVETFQAFIPEAHAPDAFTRLLRYTHQHGCWPIWCVIKKHRSDPFLLSYQVDGYSLELNYPRTGATSQALRQVLQYMIALVIEAGGRFYLAKDHFLSHAQYRQSVGEDVVECFLQLKQRCDPEMRLQSDLFRRLFRST